MHLKDGAEWEDVSDGPEGRRLMAVAKFKQLVSSGDAEAALDELVKLKQAYPEIAGPDFDKFVEAEFLFADGELFKAADKYKELLDGWPQGWLSGTALERNFSIATAFLNGYKRRVLSMINLSAFDEGEALMRDIVSRTGDAPIARRALIALARAYEKKKDFRGAYEVWVEIATIWETGDTGRLALLERAQNLHSAYQGPDYDHKSLLGAQSYYGDYRLRFPHLVEEQEIDQKLETIKEQLAYKQYSIGEYYHRTGSAAAARLYYDEVVQNWPDTKAARMAQARIDASEMGLAERKPDSRKIGQALFDASSAFVDNWFGFKLLAGSKN